MDASTYGRLVERGGYATGGVVTTTATTMVGEHGHEIVFLSRGGYVCQPAPRHPDEGAAGVLARRP